MSVGFPDLAKYSRFINQINVLSEDNVSAITVIAVVRQTDNHVLNIFGIVINNIKCVKDKLEKNENNRPLFKSFLESVEVY